MKRFIPIFLLCLLAGVAQAQQFSSEIFHDGYLVTTDEDTIRGLLKYDMETNVVQLVQGNVVKTFSSHKTFFFEIYDQLAESYRQFYSILYNVNYDYKIPIFFELIYEGPMSLLSREAIVQETVSSGASAYWGGSVVHNVVKHTYYFLDKKGKIQYFKGNKRELLTIMSKHSSEVKSFIKKNHLRTDELKDLVRITAFYNAI